MENNKDISQIALERIKESGLKPISKNFFNIRKVLFWSLVGFFILVGTLSFAVIFSILFENDWYLFNHFGFSFVLKSLPYFWLICLLLFATLGDYYYRKTLLGHRHRFFTIAGAFVIITITIGYVVYLLGFGEVIEEYISQNIPAYNKVEFDRDGFWAHPEQGLLYGKIIGTEGKIVKIVDTDSVIWNINITNAFVDSEAQIEIGKIIKIIGDKNIISDKDNRIVFNALDIYPAGKNIKDDCCSVR